MNTAYLHALRSASLVRKIGYVEQLTGLAIEAKGPDVAIGEICRILPRRADAAAAQQEGVLAEVVGIRPGVVTLMPYGASQGLAAGCEVVAEGARTEIGVGMQLLGRVIDCFGRPLDGAGMPETTERRPLKAAPVNPMHRPRIVNILETGVRSIDSLLTIGQGQRVGIFAGSGVGKSTLLGMISRHVKADVNVIALIGERGREVREFIEKQLGTEGLQRSVVVAATADQPALSRVRATYAAIAIAEYFRDQGKQVLLTMDSVTRFAMARREIGLSAGEPPTARGYTPSVFAELPEICERCGTAPSGGSITALLTVLVEGDDLNEPISDSLRAILDGHLVLSRQQAHRGQYPALDVLKSASRLMPDLCTSEQKTLAIETIKTLATLERSRQMIDIGAYEAGSNVELDQALGKQAGLMEFLRQQEGGANREEALQVLRNVMGASS